MVSHYRGQRQIKLIGHSWGAMLVVGYLGRHPEWVSHAVIVSRELGIPCVVSVKDATRRIPHGALVRVDGDAGTVTVLEDPPMTGDAGA